MSLFDRSFSRRTRGRARADMWSGLEPFLRAAFAHRRAPSLSPDETQLLQAINQGIPTPLRERYEALIAQRQHGTLTPEEHTELLRLSDEIEAIDVRRLEHLDKLARLRGVSLETVMDSLGIRAPEYE